MLRRRKQGLQHQSSHVHTDAPIETRIQFDIPQLTLCSLCLDLSTALSSDLLQILHSLEHDRSTAAMIQTISIFAPLDALSQRRRG